jgi:hypothetical protein
VINGDFIVLKRERGTCGHPPAVGGGMIRLELDNSTVLIYGLAAMRPTHYEVVLVLVVLRDSPRDQQDWCGLLMGVRGHGW